MTAGTLKREVGVFGATMMGVGSMVGAGVFVSIGIAAGIAGPAVILAIAFAAAVATCNALSSAQLAASMPVSGGTYEYGYAYLTPWLGFTAGWMFLCAKTASGRHRGLDQNERLPFFGSEFGEHGERVAILGMQHPQRWRRLLRGRP
jgi:hypothetical protein